MPEYKIVRERKEIDELVDACADAESRNTTKYKGMTFEQGVMMAIQWLTDKKQPHPLEDE